MTEVLDRARQTFMLPSPLVELTDSRLSQRDVRLALKRDDLIHPDMPGNKWRKLQRNVPAAQERGTLLTFGGAYSNHIRAAAAAGRHFGFSTVGVIRGEEHLPLNPVLAFAAAQGMRLTYLDRERYKLKNTPLVLDELRQAWGDPYVLPEGGSNELAVEGCTELAAEIGEDHDVVCCPVGTGGTIAGLAAGLRPRQRALGFAVLKGGAFLAGEVCDLQQRTLGRVTQNWEIETGFHFGGYARRTGPLDEFIADFHIRHGLLLDRVYVAKMMFGIFALVEHGQFAAGTRLVAVITGPSFTP